MSKKRIKRDGEVYALSILQVTERDEDGRARMLRLVYPEEGASTKDEPAFITAYVHENALKPQPPEEHH